MIDKLNAIEQRFDQVGELLTDLNVINDQAQYKKLMKEHKNLTPIVESYRFYKAMQRQLADAEELLSGETDSDMRELAQAEAGEARERSSETLDKLKVLLLPKDEDADKNVIVEIRGGAGGNEAALFAHSLYRMYGMFAEAHRFKVEVLSMNETELGGIKEISFGIEGDGVFGRLKYESGVHRVQRVPETESSGRIHTSTVTVAVLPEAEDVEIDINPADLEVDTYRSSGAGGQHVNKTESAIRITHVPSGIVVECQEERSQHKNRDKAMKMLRSRLYEISRREQEEKIASERKSQVGTGDRSERIRTYNFPQGRVTDHRIGLTLYKLQAFMDGDLDEMIDALITAENSERLRSGE